LAANGLIEQVEGDRIVPALNGVCRAQRNGPSVMLGPVLLLG
jgi:hypothetical protein